MTIWIINCLNAVCGSKPSVTSTSQLIAKHHLLMGLCASSGTNENTFSPPASPGGKLRVVPGTNNKYGAQETANNHSKFIIGAGNFSTVKLIKRMESPAQSLKLCKFNGQGDRKVSLKLYHRDTLEENTVLLEKIVDSSEAAVSIEHLYITRLFHSFRSPSSRVWYLCTAPFLVDLVHYISLNQLDGLNANTGKQIGAEIALALETLHKEGHVHGELRPACVLITPSGHASLSLFPSEVLCTGPPSLYQLDDARYDPPTSTSGDGSSLTYTKEDDWWCYGLILYQIFHGKPLFDGESVEAVEEKKQQRPEISIPPSDKMLANGSLHILLKGLLAIEESKRFGVDNVLQSSFFEENNAVDWKKTQYGEMENIKYCIDVESFSYPGYKETKSPNEEENWEYDVLLLDGEKNTEMQEGVDAVLLGMMKDGHRVEKESDGRGNDDEQSLFRELCKRWDNNIEVDTLNQFSLNLRANKLDKFVAYGTKVKAKSGRKLDAENAKQFKLLNDTVHSTSSHVASSK